MSSKIHQDVDVLIKLLIARTTSLFILGTSIGLLWCFSPNKKNQWIISHWKDVVRVILYFHKHSDFFFVKVDSRFLLIIWVVFSLVKSTWSHEQTLMQLIRSSSYASNQVGMFQSWPVRSNLTLVKSSHSLPLFLTFTKIKSVKNFIYWICFYSSRVSTRLSYTSWDYD